MSRALAHSLLLLLIVAAAARRAGRARGRADRPRRRRACRTTTSTSTPTPTRRSRDAQADALRDRISVERRRADVRRRRAGGDPRRGRRRAGLALREIAERLGKRGHVRDRRRAADRGARRPSSTPGEAGRARRARRSRPATARRRTRSCSTSPTASARRANGGGGGARARARAAGGDRAASALLGAGGAAAARARRRKRRARDAVEFAEAKRNARDDLVALGDDIRALDLDASMPDADPQARADYDHAVARYTEAEEQWERRARARATSRRSASALEEGRWAMASAKARFAGETPPERRPPCFFDPRHGPSTRDVMWSPPYGEPREVPACEADAQRVERGEDPEAARGRVGRPARAVLAGRPGLRAVRRRVLRRLRRRLLPGLLIGSLLGGAMSPGMAYGDYSGGRRRRLTAATSAGAGSAAGTSAAAASAAGTSAAAATSGRRAAALLGARAHAAAAEPRGLGCGACAPPCSASRSTPTSRRRARRCILRGDDRPFALIGAWAGGGALLGSEPVRVSGPGDDLFALLDDAAGRRRGDAGGGRRRLVRLPRLRGAPPRRAGPPAAAAPGAAARRRARLLRPRAAPGRATGAGGSRRS